MAAEKLNQGNWPKAIPPGFGVGGHNMRLAPCSLIQILIFCRSQIASMAEPISMTLAALSMLDPAIKSVRKAYGVYKLTKAFGDEYLSVQRRLDGEIARLEIALGIKLGIMPMEKDTEQINIQLGLLREHFQGCQDLIASIDEHTGRFQVHNLVQKVNKANKKVGVPSSHPSVQDSQVARKDGVVTASRSRKLRKIFSRKDKQSSRKSTSSGTLTPESSSANVPHALGSNGAVSAAIEQAETAENLQAKAPQTSKLRWKNQKKDFMTHVDEIKASNDLISQMVSMIALGNIHKVLIVPEVQGDVPDLVFSTQASLLRLHHALTRSNLTSSQNKPVTISLRVMKAPAYVQLKKRLMMQHDYVKFHDGPAIYPLQLQPSTAPSSTVVLADTIISAQDHAPGMHPTTLPLSRILSDRSTDTDEAFKAIGSIVDAQGSFNTYYLFEDISTSWTVQDTLADIIENEPKFSTYIHLAVQISVSYIYCISIGATHRYPRLADYRYYRPTEDDKQRLGPSDILEPYICVGFGSKAPPKSTKDIGGASSQFSGDEAMTSLGLLLHQLGCWKRLNDKDLAAERDVAKTQRKDLQTSTGQVYTEIVDVCFDAKEEDWDSRVRTEKLYQKVVAPLQKLVEDLHWD